MKKINSIKDFLILFFDEFPKCDKNISSSFGGSYLLIFPLLFFFKILFKFILIDQIRFSNRIVFPHPLLYKNMCVMKTYFIRIKQRIFSGKIKNKIHQDIAA